LHTDLGECISHTEYCAFCGVLASLPFSEFCVYFAVNNRKEEKVNPLYAASASAPDTSAVEEPYAEVGNKKTNKKGGC